MRVWCFACAVFLARWCLFTSVLALCVTSVVLVVLLGPPPFSVLFCLLVLLFLFVVCWLLFFYVFLKRETKVTPRAYTTGIAMGSMEQCFVPPCGLCGMRPLCFSGGWAPEVRHAGHSVESAG